MENNFFLSNDLIWDYVDGLLSAEDVLLVETYLRQHPGDIKRLEAIQAEKRALTSLALENPDAGFTDRVMAAWAAEQVVAATTTAKGRDWTLLAIGGIFGMILLVFFILVVGAAPEVTPYTIPNQYIPENTRHRMGVASGQFFPSIWYDLDPLLANSAGFRQIFAILEPAAPVVSQLIIMEKDKKKTKFIFQPEYPGGPKELTKFIYAQLRYPKMAFEAGIEGTVYIEYDIDYQGIVVGSRILKGLGYGCDEEAMRVVKLLKFDVARNRGIHVLFHQKVRVQFKKPKEKPVKQPVPETMQVAYTVTPAATPAEKPKEETTYSYTIKW